MKPLFTTIYPCLAAIFFAGCNEQPSDKASGEAVPEKNVQAPPTPTGNAEIKTFVLTNSSKIEWTGSKATGSLAGGFTNFVGKFEVADSKLVPKGKHFITVDMASVFSDDASLTPDLKTENFFDVAKYPIARFQLKEATLKEGDTYEISGVLDLHGMAKKINFPATLKISDKGTLLDLSAQFPINRKDFGINFPGKPDDVIEDEVVMKFTVNALPGEPVELVLLDKTEPENPGGRPGGGKGFGGKGDWGKGDKGGKGVDWRNMSEEERNERRKQMTAEMDKNKDGQLGKDEMPERMWSFMSRADKDGDEKLSEKERQDFGAEMRAQWELRELTGEGGFPGGDRGPGDRRGGPGGGPDRGPRPAGEAPGGKAE